MRLVVDANVVVKWLFADPGREKHTELATMLMSAIVEQKFPLCSQSTGSLKWAPCSLERLRIMPRRISYCSLA